MPRSANHTRHAAACSSWRRLRCAIAPAWKTGSSSESPESRSSARHCAGLHRAPQRDRLGQRVAALDVHPLQRPELLLGLAVGEEVRQVGPHHLRAEDAVGGGAALARLRQPPLPRHGGQRLLERRQQLEDLRVGVVREVLARLPHASGRAEKLEVLLGPAGHAGAGEQLAQERAPAALGRADEVGMCGPALHSYSRSYRSTRGSNAAVKKPNILYLHSHDTGRFIQPYGHQVPTPNIQRLADQGLLFRKAFCAAPDVLGLALGAAHGAVPARERDDGPGPPRVRALRLLPPHRPHAARGGLLVGADRRAAPLQGPGGARLRPRGRERHQPRGLRGAGRRRAARAGAAGAVLPLRRLLRDPSRVLRAHLGARRAVLAAARQPARHAGDAPRHGLLQGQRALAGPGRRLRAQRARRARPRRRHARDPHDRPRPRLPGRQGHAVRPRDRRAADHARARRRARRARLQRARLARGHLPDDLRPGRDRGARAPAGRARCCR